MRIVKEADNLILDVLFDDKVLAKVKEISHSNDKNEKSKLDKANLKIKVIFFQNSKFKSKFQLTKACNIFFIKISLCPNNNKCLEK